MIKVGIIGDWIEPRAARQGRRVCGFGGTGYTGVELLRLLAQHPDAELKVITSRGEAGKPVAEMFPNLRGRVDH